MSRVGTTCAYLYLNELPSDYANSVQVMSMCEGLSSNGMEVTLFAVRAPGYSGEPKDLMRQYGVEDCFDIRLLDRVDSQRSRLRAVAVTADVRGSDLVYTRSPIVATAARFMGCRYVFEMHQPTLPRLERSLFGRVATGGRGTLVVISQVLADLVASQYSIPSEQIIVAHDACRAADIRDSENESDRSGPVQAVYTGSFYAGRGVDLVLEAARRVPDVRFTLVGGTAKELGPAVAQIPRNVQIRPRLPRVEIPAVLESADILLMPYARQVTIDGIGDTSRFCSPLKLFEYLAAGRAIISTRLEAISEVLRDDFNSVLIEDPDPTVWAEEIRLLANDSSRRRRLAAMALYTARQHTWESRAAAILEAAM